ncbi:MAG: NAD-dependent succinate-semialdehyde dehydrogenase [Gammaproteobacteria bacterium]|nr:MAG: NAD-dependent succinate-semialdehyde dehydrogenase [Gammaproteobacteria bacterium]RLA23511.1 MAG: NAD-dependent succinate-semialdehyde dehydrogenase [Gammaproteobacteria bacterium]
MQNPDYAVPALYINGEWITETARKGEVWNPATEEVLASFPFADSELIDRALASSAAGFEVWRKTSYEERVDIMHRAANIIRENAEQTARHMTLELGKPLVDSKAEVENCATLLEWFANAAADHNDRTLPEMAGFADRTVRKEPIGPVAAFASWNFPASLATRKMAAAIAVGCSVIVKPAKETPASFMAVVHALDEAGLPKGVLNLLMGDSSEISRKLIESPIIRKISFTGSTPVGQGLAAMAGQQAKPCVMELGGHAPVLIFKDAAIEKVIALSVTTKSRNAGQVCISPTRFFIEEEVFDQFSEGFAKAFGALRVGDGMDTETQMGPLAHSRRVSDVDALVQDAIEQGARLLTGGKALDRPGNFYAPTVLADVPDCARIMQEEPFGPIAIMNRFNGYDDAIEKANNTDFALASYAFTGSQETADNLATDLDSGKVGINGYPVVFLDSPLGGRRMSGYGSEGGYEGLDAYRIVKFVSQSEI